MDVFFCYHLIKSMKLKLRSAIKKIRGKDSIQVFVKPESLQDQPDSPSSSDSQDDNPQAKGLSSAAQNLGAGSFLYL
jgi:hypothetical protein